MNGIVEKDFKEIITKIKEDIKTTQIKTAVQANSNLVRLYFRVGKILSNNYKYGNKFIDEVAKELK